MGRARHRVAVDAIVEVDSRIVLVKRGQDPFRGMWALPGGHVEEGEQVRDTVRREAREETGLDVAIDEILGVYDEPGRDPRGPVISIVYVCSTEQEVLEADTDAADADWSPVDDLPDELAFDHTEILDDYLAERDEF
ncbi:MAG: NUDIX domain-containing protein [Candidatus Nanohaloarchaea archaeon]